MAKRTGIIWLQGLGIGILLLFLGLAFNFRQQATNPPKCENWEHVDYVGGCPVDSNTKYYMSGWPNKFFCANNGKHSCSPWDDYLRVERNYERSSMWKENLPTIFLASSTISLIFISVRLSKTTGHADTRN
jgi:hypothetical protein